MRFKIDVGDMRDVLAGLPVNHFESCVTDPPYHLASIVKRFGKEGSAPAKSEGPSGVYKRASAGFMGQTWDGGDVAFQPATWRQVLRVLKPGAHLVAFGAPKNIHRLTCAIEDAGFEIRDSLQWMYGTGFPKSHNGDGKWEGWGSALKPAFEPVVLARKPLIGTIVENLRVWGVGLLNIDGCRIETDPEIDDPRLGGKGAWTTTQPQSGDTVTLPRGTVGSSSLGRWPANVLHDGSDEVLSAFPAAPGQQGVSSVAPRKRANVYGAIDSIPGKVHVPRKDAGSAARFFYCPKASKQDRDEGLEDASDKVLAMSNQAKAELARGNMNKGDSGMNSAKVRKNNHPTVKPTELMRYFCRLVTPPDGTILDPFMGSGSTGKAAIMEEFEFHGVDMSEDYSEIARGRIRAAGGFERAKTINQKKNVQTTGERIHDVI